MRLVILTSLLVCSLIAEADARKFIWKMGPEPDLASYRLFMQVGHCAGNMAPFVKVKTFGLVSFGWYNPPTYGTYCFYIKAIDKAGNVSKHSNKVQLN